MVLVEADLPQARGICGKLIESLVSETQDGYVICEARCKTKMHGPLLKSYSYFQEPAEQQSIKPSVGHF